MDQILWLALYVFIIYWLAKNFFGFGSEKKFEKLVEEIVDDVEKTGKDYAKHPMVFTKDFLKDLENDYKRLIETHENFLRLKERFGQLAFFKQRKLDNDWVSYVNAARRVRDSYRDFGMLDDEKLLRNVAKEKHRAILRMEEIERRFKKILSRM